MSVGVKAPTAPPRRQRRAAGAAPAEPVIEPSPLTLAREQSAADLVVIGGGPAGVTAALRARELGATVTLVERARMGGTCTNDGCVPTRVLAHAARLVRDAGQFEAYGLHGGVPQVDLPLLLRRTSELVDEVHVKKDLERHLEWAGVQVTANAGDARFVDPHTLVLGDGSTVRGRRFLICAGGHARQLSFPGSELCLTHSDIWTLTSLPRSMVIVGAAATGCQLASVFAAFGTQVTMLEVSPRILGPEDADVAAAVTEALRSRGITIVTGIAGVDAVEARDGGSRVVRFRVGDETREIEAEAVVVAVGWVGSTGELGLDAAGVETERGYIKVDDTLRTTAPHIYAAGDITGRLMLVQTASAEARLAADNAILGLDAAEDRAVVPHGGFTDPEYAGVGLTQTAAEAAASAGGEAIAVALVPYSDLDRAVIDGHTEGFGKLVVGRETRHILGAHVVGEQAVEVVQVAAAGMAAGMRIEQLAEMEIAYPTYTAVLGLCARQLVRELGVVAISPQWRALGHARLAEWERRSGDEDEELG